MLLLMMRFRRTDGPFCRNCATVVYREETAGTLWQGWWSPLSLVLLTPGTLISNRVALAPMNKLSEPAGGFPAYRARPGKPAPRRASSLAALAPLARGGLGDREHRQRRHLLSRERRPGPTAAAPAALRPPHPRSAAAAGRR
ncbi:hypothetical protein P8A22_26155 [Streptomyces laculatispora]|uniref:Uncharacterized protein n=1 Tax=Streptomyces laculatispora TaxID=887464 RepID=A0ABY9I8C1_9ACTN|nr:hypothetical protein [Streptomyces laculatispora]WLQ43103.1 hypothetical protein P8A22_26155 [Streptomyces laculatispora]